MLLIDQKELAPNITSTSLSDWIVEGILEKKGTDIVLLDLRDVKHAVADYFVVCSGNSDTQIDAIADSIEEVTFKNGRQKPWKTEGKQNKEWILLDFVDVVAHVFNKEKRSFYGLEDLWGDAKFKRIDQNQ